MTRSLAAFASHVRFSALPSTLVSRCKLLVLDCIGNQIGAYGQQAPQLAAVVTLPRGEPENPMSDDEVRGKIELQAAPVVGAGRRCSSQTW